MPHTITLIRLLVRDQDQALDFFTGALRFRLREDSGAQGAGPRWLVVEPPGGGAGLLLSQAQDEQDLALVGRQGGAGVLLILGSSDFRADYQHMQSAGVRFLEAPREEVYGTVAVFEDVCGNRWDLIQRARA
ncbi:MAG: VOC family protein [Burkholderiaceae bacterium]